MITMCPLDVSSDGLLSINGGAVLVGKCSEHNILQLNILKTRAKILFFFHYIQQLLVRIILVSVHQVTNL